MRRPLYADRGLVLPFVCVSLLLAAPLSAASDSREPLPSFHLKIGQQLAYEGVAQTRTSTCTLLTQSRADFWVLGQADYGSWRVLAIIKSETTVLSACPTPPCGFQAVAVFDLSPDGSLRYHHREPKASEFISRVFPRLPDTAEEFSDLWQFAEPDLEETLHTLRRINEPARSRDELRIRDVMTTPLDAVYQRTRHATTILDHKRGLMTSSDLEDIARFESPYETNDEMRLVESKEYSWLDTAALSAEVDRYIQARRGYTDAFKRAEAVSDARQVNDIVGEAFKELRDTHDALRFEPLRAPLHEVIDEHHRANLRLRTDVANFLQVADARIGNVAMPDAHGRTHRLADNVGNVTVLYFWSGQCGYAVRGTLPMKRIAARYNGYRVRVMGVYPDKCSTTQSRTLARRTLRNFEKNLEPGYPNLIDVNIALAEALGVRGTPTTVVLDRRGRIAHMYRGADGMEEWVVQTVDELLGADGPQAAGVAVEQ